MKLKELKEYLNSLPIEYDECPVILQKDEEGNGYSPLYCVDENAIYIEEKRWYGEVLSLNWTAHEADMSEEEWEETKNKYPRCIVLAPVN